MVTEPGRAQAHPQLIMAASLHRFGRSTAEHTLAGITSIQERGWKPSHLTADRGYFVGLAPANFHDPLSQLGIQLITDRTGLSAGAASASRSATAEMGDNWMRVYAHARHASESVSAHLQYNRRLHGRMRGLAAQSFVFTFVAAATNLHRIDTFLSHPKDEPRPRKDRGRTTSPAAVGRSVAEGLLH